jgi:hypothetical protein
MKRMILFCILLSVFSIEAADKQMEKTFDVSPGGTLYIDADLGSIRVEPVQKNSVHVRVLFEKRGSSSRFDRLMDELDLTYKQQGNDVYVSLEREHGSSFNSWGNSMNVTFEVEVPVQYHVDLKTSGGSISVGNLDGRVISSTSGGNLSFGKISGSVQGKTSGGSIQLEGCLGPVDVNTSGGSIQIGHVEGEVDAHTSGGSISVEEVLGSVQATTSGGSISARIAKQPLHDCTLKTSGGSIHIYLAEDIRVNVDAKTSGGHVQTDFPIMVEGKLSGHSLNASINGGGSLLLLRTSGGNIDLKKL